MSLKYFKLIQLPNNAQYVSEVKLNIGEKK